MLEKVRATYTNYRSLRLAACIGLIVCVALLYWLPGGFPPWALRFLFQAVPRVPQLWQGQGFAILLPLMGVICLSVMLLLFWGMLIVAFIKMVQYWWYAFRERQHFLLELHEAELLAEQMVADEMQRAAVAFSQQGYSGAQKAREGRISTNATALPPGASVEARVRPRSATSPEAVAIQQMQRTAQMVPEVAAVSLHSSPALSRGWLRLVPRA
ncbi:MAG: hypothetical protein ACJ8AG_09360, partial [Ktedonobacteraceae bacterium]